MERRFLYASAGELAAMIRNGEATSHAIVEAQINYIKNTNYKTNAFVWLFEAEALDAAKAADERVARGEPTGLLHGVPVSVKEEFWVKGKPNTLNAEMFQGFKAPRNGEIVDALVEQGAIIIGTTNVPMMLGDLQTFGEIYPAASNPYDARRTPGGSTGGGAASVALSPNLPILDKEAVEDLEDTPEAEAEAIEEQVLDQATAARSIGR